MEPRSGARSKLKLRCLVNYCTSRRPAIDAYGKTYHRSVYDNNVAGEIVVRPA